MTLAADLYFFPLLIRFAITPREEFRVRAYIEKKMFRQLEKFRKLRYIKSLTA